MRWISSFILFFAMTIAFAFENGDEPEKDEPGTFSSGPIIPAPAYKRDPHCEQSEAAKGVDLRSGLGPIRDQDSIAWCVAEGEAEQMNYWMVKNKIPGVGLDRAHTVSAAGAALSQNNSVRNELYGQFLAQAEDLRRSKELVQIQSDQLKALNVERTALEKKLTTSVPQLLELSKTSENFKQQVLQTSREMRTLPDGDAKTAALEKYAGLTNQFNRAIAKLLEALAQQPEMQKLDRKVGTVLGSLKFNESKINSSAEPGLEVEERPEGVVLRNLIANGVCLEQDIHSEDFANEQFAAGMQENYAVNFFNGPSAEKNAADSLKIYIAYYIGEFYKEPSRENLCAAADKLSRVFASVKKDEIVSILQKYRESDPIRNLLTKSCKPIVLPENNIPKLEVIYEKDKVFKAVTDNLNQEIPTGISIPGDLFDLPKQSSGLGSPPPKGTHYLLVVGRHLNCATGDTEYILRNSWGKGACGTKLEEFTTNETVNHQENYAPLAQCKAKCADEFPSQIIQMSEEAANLAVDCLDVCNSDFMKKVWSKHKPPFTCDNGDFVISEKKLKRAATSATSIH